ncbi:MAG: hypothetical protein GF417_13380 [Candidatus Latescibacteria bacterium]|nr:hypothetical protein [bacterium]MBD3425420.1 hypothetical protein [Candidatus Latescibacterota bacterium]
MNGDTAGEAIAGAREALGRKFFPEEEKRLALFINDILEMGRKTHLVGRERIGANIIRQVADSAILLDFFERECAGKKRVADIGSGAGFPGMVWKILNPDLQVWLIERKGKLADFLSREKRRLRLEGVDIFREDALRLNLPPSGAVVSKAAGRLNKILPLAERLLEGGGFYITIKEPGWDRSEMPQREGVMVKIIEQEVGRGRGTVLIFRKGS